MRFVFIDDDSDNRKQWVRWAKQKGHRAQAVESVFEAVDLVADYYVLDMSAVGDMLRMHAMYSPICKLAELHPGAGIIILSACSENSVRGVIDDVAAHIDGLRIEYGGWGPFEGVEKALAKLEPYEEDF